MSRNALKSWIEDNSISRVDLARRLGVTPSAISYYESGDRRPRMPVATRLAEISQGAVPLKVWGEAWGDMKPSGTVGSNTLLRWMADYGLTMRDAARFFGLYPQTIRNLITRNGLPTRSTIKALREKCPARFAEIKAGDFE